MSIRQAPSTPPDTTSWQPATGRVHHSTVYRILSISRNVRLLLERNNLLSFAGFSVISPRYAEQAAVLAAQEEVDAFVVGHSVEPEMRRRLIAEVRDLCPRCLICFVYAAPDKTGEPLADISLDITKGPEPLILALQERLPRIEAKAS